MFFAAALQVLDRALLGAAGQNWWTVLSGRMRAQHAWQQHKAGMTVLDAVTRLENYGLCSHTHAELAGRCEFALQSGTPARTLLKHALII